MVHKLSTKSVIHNFDVVTSDLVWHHLWQKLKKYGVLVFIRCTRCKVQVERMYKTLMIGTYQPMQKTRELLYAAQ